MATPDGKDSSGPGESQITLWSRLWSCTRGEALSRIMATRQIMVFRSTEKSAAKDRKWVQVASMWEPQGIGRLEWEHWVQTGSFGADVEVFGVRGLSRSGRGSESSYGEASEDDERDGEKDAATGDVSPTSTDDSHGNAAPPPSPASPPYPHSIPSSDDSIADDILQAALALVDEHGVERGEVVAKAVWTALRDHLECVRHGGECTASCLVCKLIRAKFDQIRDEHGSCKKRRDSPDWSTAVNASESPRSNDVSFAAPAEAGVDVGPHELDASQTSKRSIDEALPPDERVGLATASPVVFVPPPRHVTYRSYQATPASRAIVFDSSASSSLHPHRARLVPVSGRSRSEPCLSQHPIHIPLSPLLSPTARTLDTPLVSPRTGIDTSNINGNINSNGNAKPSPLRAIAHFVNNKSKQLFERPHCLSLPRHPRSAPPSLIGSPIPPGAAAQMGGRRRSSFAFPFSPRPDGVFGRGRFASFSPLCSPRTVDTCAPADGDGDGAQGDETAATAAARALFSPPPEREREREGKSTFGAGAAVDTAAPSTSNAPSMTTSDGRRRGSGKTRRASASARAWSSVVAGPTATARKWARRNAARVLPGGGGQSQSQSQDAGLRGGGRGRGGGGGRSRGRDGADRQTDT
ncbi:hypothetical protein BKA80DRAFT_255965 [Phyllosticta citrichinensis]